MAYTMSQKISSNPWLKSGSPEQDRYKLLVDLAKEFYGTSVYFFKTNMVPKSMFGWGEDTYLDDINAFHLEPKKAIYIFQPDHRPETLTTLCIVLAHEMGHAAATLSGKATRAHIAGRVTASYYSSGEVEYLRKYIYAEDLIRAYELVLEDEEMAWVEAEDILKMTGFTDWTAFNDRKERALDTYRITLVNRKIAYITGTIPLNREPIAKKPDQERTQVKHHLCVDCQSFPVEEYGTSCIECKEKNQSKEC
jgi:hypothetical protein